MQIKFAMNNIQVYKQTIRKFALNFKLTHGSEEFLMLDHRAFIYFLGIMTISKEGKLIASKSNQQTSEL